MEPEDDLRLRALLREWHAPCAPEELEDRVMARQRWCWSRLLVGSISIPIPAAVAAAVLLALAVGGTLLFSPRPQPQNERAVFSLKGFEPVKNPQVRIVRSSYAD